MSVNKEARSVKNFPSRSDSKHGFLKLKKSIKSQPFRLIKPTYISTKALLAGSAMSIAAMSSMNANAVTLTFSDPGGSQSLSEPPAIDVLYSQTIQLQLISDPDDDILWGTETCTITGNLNVSGSSTEGTDYTITNRAFTLTTTPLFVDGQLASSKAALPVGFNTVSADITISALEDSEMEGTETINIELPRDVIATCEATGDVSGQVLKDLSYGYDISITDTFNEPEPEPSPQPSPEPEPEPSPEPEPEPEPNQPKSFIGVQALKDIGQGSLVKQTGDMAALTRAAGATRTRNLLEQIRRSRSRTEFFDRRGLSVEVGNVNINNLMLPSTDAGEDPEKNNYASAGDVSEGFDRWGTFVNGSVEIGERNSNNFSSSDFNSTLFIAGVDYRLSDKFSLGGALARNNASTDVNTLETEFKQYSAAVFASYYEKESSFYVDMLMSSGASDFELLRDILGESSSTGSASSETNGNEFSVAIASGYTLRAKNIDFRFSGMAVYLDTSIDGYNENTSTTFSGATVNDIEIETLFSNISLDLSWIVNTSKMVLVPQFSLGWEHHYNDEAIDISGVLARGANEGDFRYQTDVIDSDYLTGQVGLSAVFQGGITSFINYDTYIDREDIESNNISLGVRFEF
ncbi:MAG: hypothetical protein ACI93R_003359 [Flavobacteriales bacterium]